MIRCCIFDLDGTLLNTLSTITYYVNKTLRNHGIGEITEEECRTFIGNGAKFLIRRALASKGIVDNEFAYELLDEYNSYYNADTMYMTTPYFGVPQMLAALKDKGVLLGVVTNKPNDTANDIISRFFSGVFDDVRGAAPDVPLKPAPDAVVMMISRFGLAPADVAYIGDTGVDIETGKGAMVGRTVGVSWGFRTREELHICGADVIVDSPADVLREVCEC